MKQVAIVFLILIFAAIGYPQSSTPNVASPGAKADSAAKQPTTEKKVARWLEIEQLTAAMRYHFIENDNKAKAANNAQYAFGAKFRFKFDKKAKYTIFSTIATGSAFTTLWNATGWGTGIQQRSFNVRQLYFDAKPNKAIEVQFGGLYVNYADITEAITYDNDNYITGARVTVRAPKKLYFDEISATTATMSDFLRPDIFHRLRHLDVQNYHSFLARKQFTNRISATFDYTFESGIDTFHQAVKIKIPPKHFIDTFLFENYERVDPDKNYGFNIFGEKVLNKMFTASGGFADIHMPNLLNADRFPPGKRFYLTGQTKLSPEFTLLVQFIQGVGPIADRLPRTRLDIILGFNVLEALKRTKFF